MGKAQEYGLASNLERDSDFSVILPQVITL